MKNLRKIIALFLSIFIIGVLISIVTVQNTLHKKSDEHTVNVQQDSIKIPSSQKTV